ncbi:MAG: type II toxin-antitoxin system PemK/MazF family toxin [Deltaproteobacteria bacterium]|nr:type II toxin-antitoxin system PemK/MazF family toxin [Deltaproteobacteria bacterium]
MAISFHPDHGSILMCDFNTGFTPPEVIKKRPVVVISPRRNNFQVCTVIPLSRTSPNPIEKHHHRLDPASLPKSLSGRDSWAKCDMIMTVSLSRLDRIQDGRGPGGVRKYTTGKLTPEDFRAVRIGILYAIGLNSLTIHVP